MCKQLDNCPLPGKVSHPMHPLPVLLTNLFRACSFLFSPMKASALSTLNPMTSPHLHLVKDVFGIKKCFVWKEKHHYIAKMRLVVLSYIMSSLSYMYSICVINSCSPLHENQHCVICICHTSKLHVIAFEMLSRGTCT